jgi:hypothetical protein
MASASSLGFPLRSNGTVAISASLTSAEPVKRSSISVFVRPGATAFTRIPELPCSENVKLAVIAQRVVEEAVQRAQARHSQAQTRYQDGLAAICEIAARISGRASGWAMRRRDTAVKWSPWVRA